MRGIDVYHGDGWPLKPVPAKAYKESDFVIVKATQGVSYKYTDYFGKMMKKAISDGKLIGAYHYAAGNDAVKEADYFLSIVKDYVGKAILCLDWESMQNKAWGSKTWCEKFIKRIKEKTGVTCFLYTGTDGMKQCASLAGKVPLWFAGYPENKNSWSLPKFKYNLGSWKKYAIWQFTSGREKVDRNTTELTPMQWRFYANPPSADKLLKYLKIYDSFIKTHGMGFVNKYDGNVICFAQAKKLVEDGKTCGITCVVPTRWALYEMGITGHNGKALISTEKGTFGKYYEGVVKDVFTRITKNPPIGLNVKQAVDKKLLMPGDILCFEDLTHIAVYSGSGYIMYEGGGGCAINGHYPNGIKKDYSTIYTDRKISEILRFKTSIPKTSPSSSTKESSSSPTVKKTADILLTQARAWLGCKESDGSHKKIIDLYNSYKPLARGYKVKYTDAWCATFVSACAIACNYVDLIPLECSCEKMIALMKKKGIWVENENRTPAPGDIIFYDWQDSGKGDNKGSADHVGIVEKVSGGKITVIEGNYKDAVGRRTIAVNGRYIRGYGVPKYDKTSSSKKSITEIAKEVISGKWGNGDDRKKRLKAAGYDYTAVQKEVNRLLK